MARPPVPNPKAELMLKAQAVKGRSLLADARRWREALAEFMRAERVVLGQLLRHLLGEPAAADAPRCGGAEWGPGLHNRRPVDGTPLTPAH